MSYKVKTIVVFEKQAKRLTKKYASLKNELMLLISHLKENPEQGTPLGKNCYNYVLLYLLKKRVKAEVPGLLQILY